jgi:riboflavin synthase
MFTGIIETMGVVVAREIKGTNLDLWIRSDLSSELKIDQSVSHNGVCLTVVEADGGMHRVTAIEETIQRTNLGTWLPHTKVNLERCVQAGGRLDGHIVQGHVDACLLCQSVAERDGSWWIEFAFPESYAHLIVEKGSVCLDGISLTVAQLGVACFAVAIIPYTWANTNVQHWKAGTQVNFEADILGKYVARWMNPHIGAPIL